MPEPRESRSQIVFPAAGLGTRFLPATKAQPKEMLPLVDKPIIQYGVEEATASGVEDIILVTGRGKNAIEDHFDVAIELETLPRGARQDRSRSTKSARISNTARSVSYVRQGEPLGLGHAVLVARPLVGNEPFAVILADDVIDATPPALAQMIEVFRRSGRPGDPRRARAEERTSRATASSPPSRCATACTASRIWSRSRRSTRRRRISRSSAATS